MTPLLHQQPSKRKPSRPAKPNLPLATWWELILPIRGCNHLFHQAHQLFCQLWLWQCCTAGQQRQRVSAVSASTSGPGRWWDPWRAKRLLPGQRVQKHVLFTCSCALNFFFFLYTQNIYTLSCLNANYIWVVINYGAISVRNVTLLFSLYCIIFLSSGTLYLYTICSIIC